MAKKPTARSEFVLFDVIYEDGSQRSNRRVAAELLGGLAMIVGFLVRPAAVGLIIVMLVAIAKVHAPNGFFINWSMTPGKGHGFEMNLALIAMALGVLFGGAGWLSIDRCIFPW